MQETNDERSNRHDGHNSFWSVRFNGDPVWYIAAMTAVGIYFGALAETLRIGDSVVLIAFIAAIAAIFLLHVVSRRRDG